MKQPGEKVHRRRDPIGVRRPRLVLAGAAVAMAFLGLLSLGLTEKLQPTLLTIPGTESARGNEMLKEHFGESAPFAILLEGPPEAIDRQGPRLIAVLRTYPNVTTLSSWDRGAGLGLLRRGPRKALILADFHVPEKRASEESVPLVERLLAKHISPPVTALTASYARVSRELQEDTIAASHQTEMIVMPILIIVLLLVFRSPIAAAIPLIFGGMTVVAARGLISLSTGLFEMTSFSLGIASMLGLALGVDYTLLMVSRFREELAAGATPAEAAAVTRLTAGRTTIFAGCTLLAAVLIVVLLVPGPLLLSLSATVVGVVALAVIGPAIVGPALLMLIGHNIDRWQIPRRRPAGTRWIAISRSSLRRPYLAAGSILVLLLAIAMPAFLLSTGAPSLEELSPEDQVRLDVEAIEASVGGGWMSPSLVVLNSEDGPMTEPERLAAINRWQAEIARYPNVEAVIGPGRLVEQTAPLRDAGRSFLGKGGGSTQLEKVSRNLGRAGDGLTRLRDGLARASAGALLLATGSERAHWGSGLISDGLNRAASGGDRAQVALSRFQEGAHLLADGERAGVVAASVLGFAVEEAEGEAARALPAGRKLEKTLGEAEALLPVSQQAAAETQSKLEAAWRELNSMSVGTSDPHYAALASAVRDALKAASGTDPVTSAAYAPGYAGLASAIATLQTQLSKAGDEAGDLNERLADIRQGIGDLGKLAAKLEKGMEALSDGSDRLADGTDRIAEAATRLSGGFERLRDGSVRLTDGLERLHGGNAALARGLSMAYRRTRPLEMGARKAEVRIRSARGGLRRSSPGFFDSGYFVLSALDGAPNDTRELAGQAIDLTSGGQAAQILVVSTYDMNDPGLTSLNDRLRRSADTLARETGATVAVTGSPAQLVDYDRATRSRIPTLAIVTVLVTLLVLIVVLRAIPLAVITVILNLFTAAAAFGALGILFEVPDDWPLAGAGDFDAVTAACIFGVVFGMSIDYAVFLLMRMRESWERDGDNDAAILYGLERTAGVITGAATIMAIIFLVFGFSPVPTVAQFGVALTVAILLDATVIRLILLPVLMTKLGAKVWWLPAWLDRRLPRLNVDG